MKCMLLLSMRLCGIKVKTKKIINRYLPAILLYEDIQSCRVIYINKSTLHSRRAFV